VSALGDAAPAPELLAAAESAGLRYATAGLPGIERRRAGKAFRYLDARGRAVREPATLERIRKLAIPPAWTRVWIAPRPDLHLQATGYDARGRKQYRYHAEWRAARDATKFERLPQFARALPAIRRRVRADLRLPGMPRPKVLAAVVRLLETTCIRVGNEEYARDNDSFGLTTLRDRHVRPERGGVRLRFRGKSGVQHESEVTDTRLARIIRACQELPGEDLFQYLDDDGMVRDVRSEDVNAYIREISRGEFTAKDFRTWLGTVEALHVLVQQAPDPEEADAEGKAGRRRSIVAAIDEVAERLGNTRAVCRKFYIHPLLLEARLNGVLGARLRRIKPRSTRGLRAEERQLVALLADLTRHPPSVEEGLRLTLAQARP
jgi:DNA topoisomerase-1